MLVVENAVLQVGIQTVEIYPSTYLRRKLCLLFKCCTVIGSLQLYTAPPPTLYNWPTQWTWIIIFTLIQNGLNYIDACGLNTKQPITMQHFSKGRGLFLKKSGGVGLNRPNTYYRCIQLIYWLINVLRNSSWPEVGTTWNWT